MMVQRLYHRGLLQSVSGRQSIKPQHRRHFSTLQIGPPHLKMS